MSVGGPYREVREPDAVMRCPGCRYERLEPIAVADAELLTCAACGGAFVPAPLLARITDARDPIAIALLDEPRVSRSPRPPNRRIPCPSCREPMAERPFGPRCEVLVDECRLHGVWFERGALREGASFVASGGFRRVARAPQGPAEVPLRFKVALFLIAVIDVAAHWH